MSRLCAVLTRREPNGLSLYALGGAMRKLLLTLVPLLFLAACDREPAGPNLEAVQPTPAFDWMNNPANGNLNVYREAVGLRACWTDPDNGLRVCHATYPIGATTSACDIQSESDPISLQIVGAWVHEYSEFLHAVEKGNTYVVIRDTRTPGDCYGNALVAQGWGRFVYTDNDIAGGGVNNANAWMNRGHGVLEAPDGNRVAYNGHFQLQFSESQGLRLLSAKVDVH